MTYNVYGENGKELPEELHTYEIGSLTKTFTSAMICKGIQEEKIHMDEIGMAWIIDKENNIVWHNGGTGKYNCYLGFNVENKIAVIVLSNLSPSYRIPATVLGVKLLQSMN